MMAMIKSNAYGHGLVQVAKLLAAGISYQVSSIKAKKELHNTKYRIPYTDLWFGVDSITEAVRLRDEGIKNPILVLGYTLPRRLSEAAKSRLSTWGNR